MWAICFLCLVSQILEEMAGKLWKFKELWNCSCFYLISCLICFQFPAHYKMVITYILMVQHLNLIHQHVFWWFRNWIWKPFCLAPHLFRKLLLTGHMQGAWLNCLVAFFIFMETFHFFFMSYPDQPFLSLSWCNSLDAISFLYFYSFFTTLLPSRTVK